MMNTLIRCLCLVFLVSTELSLAEPISLSGEVEAGSEDNRLSIRIKNKTDMPVEGVNLSVGEKPSFIKGVVITPSTIEEIAPKHSETFEVSFNVDPELKEDQNATVTFMLSTAKGKLETNTATLDLSVKALEAPSTSLCWSRVEGGTLVLHDPPLDECEFNGPCEAAAAFARQNSYGFDGAGRCEAVPETKGGPHILKLVSATGPPPGKTKGISDLEIRYQKDSVTALFLKSRSYTYEKGAKSIDIASFGFASYPKSIELGKPFSASANMIRQQNHFNRSCKSFLSKKTFKPKTLKRKPQTLDFTISLQIPFNYPSQKMKASSSGKVEYEAPCVPEVNHVRDPVTFDVGGTASVKLSCQPDPKGPERESSDSLNYHYDCTVSGSGVEKTTSKATLFWKENKNGPPKENKINKISVSVGGKGLGHYGRPYESITLHYEPDASGTLQGRDFGTVQHEGTVRNTWQDGGADSGEQQETAGGGRSEEGGDGPGSTGDQVVSGSQEGDSLLDSGETIPHQAAREKEKRRPHIEHWLRHAQPVENAQPGYHLTFDKWGRVQGKAGNGTITLNSEPAGAGTDSAEFAWTHNREKDSLNLCTLGEYVERQLAGMETASCQKKVPPPIVDYNSVPNLVGTPANQAKTQLAELGVPIHLKAGSVSSNASQTGTVEKQNPPPGTDLKTVDRVELWVYRKVANTTTVPNVVGMYFKKAAEKLMGSGLIPSMGKTYLARSRENAGKVVSQETPPGKNIAKGATVVLNVNRGGIYKTRMPNIVGMKYEEAAAKLKLSGLKPSKKLGPHAPRQDMVNTVARTGLPKTNQKIALGTAVSVTVYNTYSNKSRQREKIVKRDPASGFGKEIPPEKPEVTAGDWAGMWHIIGKYDMELHVSGNKVTGKYGTKFEYTVEGTISGNTLTAWWRAGKTYGRFKNKISDDGNSWSGNWNWMKETLGGWNGGWKAKRIGEKKQPENFSKREPSPGIDGSGGGKPSPSGMFKCETGIPGLIVEQKGRKYPDRKNGVLKTDILGEKNYICRYKIQGRQRVALIAFFDTPPANAKGKKLKKQMCDSTGNIGYAKGKAVAVFLGTSSLIRHLKSRVNVDKFLKYHLNQVAPHAISCSGPDRPNTSQPRVKVDQHSNVNVPNRMNCEAGIAGLRTDNKKRVASIQHGEVKVRKDGIADHSCWYKTSSGQEVLVKPSFFVNRPATRLSGKKGRNLAAFCDQPVYSDVYGVGANGKAMNITIGKYSANKLTRSQLQQLVSFHTNQMTRYAISCSGDTRSNSSSRSGNSGITINRSRQKMQGGNFGGGSSCRWDGGHDMLGIPGVEVRVYCKCNGKIVNDSRCSGQKPKGNHYYGK